MKKLFLALVVLVVSCSFVFAGGSAEASESSDDGQYKVALIIENTIDDRGWCQSMHEGILGAMEQLPGKIHYEYSERMTTVDAESIARQYIADGFDLIIAHGSQYRNMVSDLSQEFPCGRPDGIPSAPCIQSLREYPRVRSHRRHLHHEDHPIPYRRCHRTYHLHEAG